MNGYPPTLNDFFKLITTLIFRNEFAISLNLTPVKPTLEPRAGQMNWRHRVMQIPRILEEHYWHTRLILATSSGIIISYHNRNTSKINNPYHVIVVFHALYRFDLLTSLTFLHETLRYYQLRILVTWNWIFEYAIKVFEVVRAVLVSRDGA